MSSPSWQFSSLLEQIVRYQIKRLKGLLRATECHRTFTGGNQCRDKQLAVVGQLTQIIAQAAADPTLVDRTWVLLTEAPDGGWGLKGHANTNEELVAAARAEIASMAAKSPPQS